MNFKRSFAMRVLVLWFVLIGSSVNAQIAIDNTATTAEMADEMFGNGLTVNSATLIGSGTQSGIFTNGTVGGAGFAPSDTGLLFMTAPTGFFDNGDSTNSHVDFTASGSNFSSNGNAGSGPGDADINALDPDNYFDASGIIINFTSHQSGTITLPVQYMTDEYPQYYQQGFSDIGAVFIREAGSGSFVLVPASGTANGYFEVDTLPGPPPGTTPPIYNGDTGNTLSVQTDFNAGELGSVPVTLVAGTTYELKIVIADQFDAGFDSAFLISGGQFGFPPLDLEAVNDTITGVDTSTDQTGVINVLTNDDASGSTPTPSDVEVSVASGSSLPAGVTLNPDGSVDVAANTPSGTYTFDYTICELAGGSPTTNCETATVSIGVDGPIVAQNDTVSGIDGVTGATGVVDIFANNGNGIDTLNGTGITAGDVVLTQSAPATPIDGGPVPTLNTATGLVDVPAGTPAGTYNIAYQICETAFPTNCDTATIEVIVAPIPIEAEDDMPPSVVGSAGDPSLINVFDNDSVDEAQATASTVDATVLTPAVPVSAGQPVPELDPATGIVSVPAGTPADTYTIEYQICKTTSPTDCETAEVTVVVDAAPIIAMDDTPAAVFGSIGDPSVVNVLDNDTLNGLAIDTDDITTTVTTTAIPASNGANVPVLDPATGNVSVPAGTPEGTYTIAYEICEDLNPTNCSDATVTVEVEAVPVVAGDDTPPSVNGFEGDPSVMNAFDNDTLDGNPIDTDDITASIRSAAAPLAPGAPVPALDPATGIVSVPAGTPAGTYMITYDVCENLNPTNCDTATATVVVDAAPIAAGDDTPPSVNGLVGDPSIANAFDNDTLNGVAVDPADIIATITTPATPATPGAPVPAMDPATGVVSVPPNTPAGSYTIAYQICEELNPTNCETATITVDVDAAPIAAGNDTPGSVNGLTGNPSVVDAFANDTLNGVVVDASDVTASVTTPATPATPGAPVPVFETSGLSEGNVSVPPNTPAGTYTIVYELCEDLNPTNCDSASITVVVDPAPLVAEDDVVSGVNGFSGAMNVLSVLDDNGNGTDTLNGAPIVPSAVTITTATPATSLGGAVPVLNSDGTVDVPAGTTAGAYTIVYEVCENLNPTNCEQATITVNVDPPVINAVDDSVSGVDGFTGETAVINVLDSNGSGPDLLNGAAVDPSDVTIAQTVPATPANPGDPIPVVNTDGTVDVPAGTPAGTYTMTYEICETLNTANCETATVTVDVEAPAIDARVESTPTIDGSAPPAGTIMNVLTSDVIGGAPATPANVDITLISIETDLGAPYPEIVLDPATGNVTMTGPAGGAVVEVTYQICDVANPTNCNTVTETIAITPLALEALPEAFPPINGLDGGVTTSVLASDLVDDTPADFGRIEIPTPVASDYTDAATGDPVTGLTLDPTTGLITVAPNTPAGTYNVAYEICTLLAPVSCDEGIETVIVEPAPLVAADDMPAPVNGFEGNPSVVNVFDNDTLNGDPVDPDETTATVTSPATPVTPGAPVPELDPSTGIVSVPAGTPAGPYTISYEICEDLNPTNCETAVVTVVVDPAPSVATDDTPPAVNGLVGDPDVVNAFTNDTLNGAPVDPADIMATVLTPASPLVSGAPVPVLDPVTGTVSVPPNTPAGPYTIEYEICEELNPSNCDTASISVTVDPAPIVATSVTPPAVDGLLGNPTLVNVLDTDTIDGNPVDPADVTVSVDTPATPQSPGAPVPVLDPSTGVISVPPNTPAGPYTITYEICEDLNPTNCDTATVSITVSEAPVAVADDTPPSVNGFIGNPSLVDAFANDTVGGVAVDPADVTATVTTPATPVLPGDPVPTLSVSGPNEGEVSVPAGTPAGTYTIDYQLCEDLNPTNCDVATITVVVDPPEIVATDDTLPAPFDGSFPTANILDVLGNDTLNGTTIVRPDVIVTPVGPMPAGFVLNPDGTIDVTNPIISGTYTFEYQVCEVDTAGDATTNCETATVTIPVVSSVPSIAGTVFADSNGNGTLDGGETRLGGYLVELRNASGALVATTTTDPTDGTYQIGGFEPGSGYSIVFRDPDTNLAIGGLNDLTFGPKSIFEDQNQPIDPAGVIYNSVTGDPIPGVTLELQTAAGVPLPDACLLPGQQSQTTGASGDYAFDIIPGADPACPTASTEYLLAVTGIPSGFGTAPSVVHPPESGVLDATTCNGLDAVAGGACQLSASSLAPSPSALTPYFFSFSIGAGDPEILNNHVALDPDALIPTTGLSVTKAASVSSARLGDTIAYTIEAINTNPIPAGVMNVVDNLPAGLLFTPGSAQVDGVPVVPTQVGNALTFSSITVPGSGRLTITLMARVSTQAQPGVVTNRATLIDPLTGAILAPVGTADVRIVAEHVFDCADIIGKVFDDKNHNGYQNEGEPGLPGVRLATVRGSLITTDEHGRYSVPCAELPRDVGSNFTLKLDTRTLPTGYRVTSENPRTIRVTAGKFAKLNFGASISRVVDINLSDAAFEAGEADPTDRLVEGIEALVRQMRDTPSVIRLSYLSEQEDRRLLKARLNSVEKLLRKTWKTEGRYKLVIERTIKGSE